MAKESTFSGVSGGNLKSDNTGSLLSLPIMMKTSREFERRRLFGDRFILSFNVLYIFTVCKYTLPTPCADGARD